MAAILVAGVFQVSDTIWLPGRPRPRHSELLPLYRPVVHQQQLPILACLQANTLSIASSRNVSSFKKIVMTETKG